MSSINALINPMPSGGNDPSPAESSARVGEEQAAFESTQSENTNKVPQEVILESFERIKTHFPAARIKKIMQSDEDIGKVAQATPVIVGRALEIFMANLVEASVVEAKKAGVRKISASHIRSAVENTEQFDFLVDAVEKYPPAES
ncbi:Piso0_005704 [Millerozyma farinosa CBS 7064]|uniref:Piso0_005704 protein n=1 Tax=Pichia sorbitophila (strain ATCC MYA-4447 / BCRC 22081 / CBS 7064 / NBRC 10061 / NRRL Y-12695) TaxID=559304 RepID=G8Y2P6_PICSO|nr:Piso0_005704 [Millerozyma farinosa CBS 7064]